MTEGWVGYLTGPYGFIFAFAAGVLSFLSPYFLTRQNLRPAAYFRKDKQQTVPDGRSHLFCEEIVAGLLEPEDAGDECPLAVALVERARAPGGGAHADAGQLRESRLDVSGMRHDRRRMQAWTPNGGGR